MFLNSASVVCTLCISSNKQVQIHSALQLCIHVANKAFSLLGTQCLLQGHTHSHHCCPQGVSRGGPCCSQHPSEVSRALHLSLPCQNKAKQTKSLCLMLDSRRTDSSLFIGYNSSLLFLKVEEPFVGARRQEIGVSMPGLRWAPSLLPVVGPLRD